MYFVVDSRTILNLYIYILCVSAYQFHSRLVYLLSIRVTVDMDIAEQHSKGTLLVGTNHPSESYNSGRKSSLEKICSHGLGPGSVGNCLWEVYS